ncbi:MAG TPA: nucleotidyltransferase family protein [Bacteroidales bacterium]|nr:NTP transferase domain-containing protein [Bacteroidales bacterium]HNR41722.1 nucleotidyltransferase family protein [Bacteroidales bacterium]HPM19418.1 nucleotidyltransferase family protein [Bacteroidales bacterium]
MKAMIMAAGKGTRLGRITQTIPKVLVDINGKSLLQRAVETCSRFGFDDIIINVHYLADQVEEEIQRLRRLGFRLSVSDERERLLENGGGLFKARDFFDNDPFLVYNADIVTDLDLSALLRYHREKNGLATLAVRKREGSRFFLVNGDGMLKGWCNNATGEKILAGDPGSAPLTEIGFSSIQILDPVIFSYMTEGIYTVVDLYLKLAPLHNIFTYRHDSGYWFNVGTPENLEKVREYLA